MSGSIILTISLFGAFRAFSGDEPLIIEVPYGATLEHARHALKQALKRSHPDFSNDALVDESALADEKEVLPEHATFTHDMALAILPPVCGG